MASSSSLVILTEENTTWFAGDSLSPISNNSVHDVPINRPTATNMTATFAQTSTALPGRSTKIPTNNSVSRNATARATYRIFPIFQDLATYILDPEWKTKVEYMASGKFPKGIHFQPTSSNEQVTDERYIAKAIQERSAAAKSSPEEEDDGGDIYPYPPLDHDDTPEVPPMNEHLDRKPLGILKFQQANNTGPTVSKENHIIVYSTTDAPSAKAVVDFLRRYTGTVSDTDVQFQLSRLLELNRETRKIYDAMRAQTQSSSWSDFRSPLHRMTKMVEFCNRVEREYHFDTIRVQQLMHLLIQISNMDSHIGQLIFCVRNDAIHSVVGLTLNETSFSFDAWVLLHAAQYQVRESAASTRHPPTATSAEDMAVVSDPADISTPAAAAAAFRGTKWTIAATGEIAASAFDVNTSASSNNESPPFITPSNFNRSYWNVEERISTHLIKSFTTPRENMKSMGGGVKNEEDGTPPGTKANGTIQAAVYAAAYKCCTQILSELCAKLIRPLYTTLDHPPEESDGSLDEIHRNIILPMLFYLPLLAAANGHSIAATSSNPTVTAMYQRAQTNADAYMRNEFEKILTIIKSMALSRGCSFDRVIRVWPLTLGKHFQRFHRGTESPEEFFTAIQTAFHEHLANQMDPIMYSKRTDTLIRIMANKRFTMIIRSMEQFSTVTTAPILPFRITGRILHTTTGSSTAATGTPKRTTAAKKRPRASAGESEVVKYTLDKKRKLLVGTEDGDDDTFLLPGPLLDD